MGLDLGLLSSADVTIRPGYPSDLPATSRVLSMFNMPPPRGVPTFVAERDGGVFGCASLYYAEQGFGWLANVAVERGARRSGVGSRLVEACLARAEERDLPSVWLTTMFWNRRFYEGRGFQFIPVGSVGDSVRRHRQNDKCLFMRLLLPHAETPPTAGLSRARLLVEPL